MAEYIISPLSVENAQKITTWRYDPPYDLYDLDPEHLSGLLNIDYRYHQVMDLKGSLVGYCCFGLDAQVPGGDYQHGEPAVLDIGVGLRPDLIGKGLGSDFVSDILDFTIKEFKPEYFRVTIADFNQRSQKTFRDLGFKETYQFIRDLVEIPFTQLERKIVEETK